MTTWDDGTDGEDADELRAEHIRQLRSVIAGEAIAALRDVVNDPKAPAPARATAGVALLRAAGFFDKADELAAKDPSEMTLAELKAATRKSRARIDQLSRSGAEEAPAAAQMPKPRLFD